MNKLIACFLMTISVGLFAENKTSHLETIVLGSGCFWGAEKGYESLVGVYDAVSGYSDGGSLLVIGMMDIPRASDFGLGTASRYFWGPQLELAE